MPRYSIAVISTREVVVNAPNPKKAAKKAAQYSRDVIPSCRLVCSEPPVLRPNDYTSRTMDDADEIPRDT